MINDIKVGPLANAIAFHDFRPEEFDTKDWFFFVEDWLSRWGFVPTKMEIGSPYDSKSRKPLTYKTGKKRLIEHDFQNLKYIVIYSTPGSDVNNISLSFCQAKIRFGENDRSTLVMFWDDQIRNFSREYFEKLTQDLSDYFSPKYGYCFQRKFIHGPAGYVTGAIYRTLYDGPSDLERAEITKWGNSYNYASGKYKLGDLRDIYPLNILSQPHLERDVHGKSLKNWIESSPEHGDLKKLTDTLWSWWVPKDRIESVREKLRDTGILLCVLSPEEQPQETQNDTPNLSGTNLDPFGVPHLYSE